MQSRDFAMQWCPRCRVETAHAGGACWACAQFKRHGARSLDESLKRRLHAGSVPMRHGRWVCRVWTRARTEKGYGLIGVGKRARRAHRVAFELAHGGLGSVGRLMVLHRCDNPPCVKVAHLIPGTAQDNTDDMVAKGRDDFARRKAQAH